ncbi:MAG: class I adenylate-forming enzyme family protein [Gammaproteobacteria bacterium]
MSVGMSLDFRSMQLFLDHVDEALGAEQPSHENLTLDELTSLWKASDFKPGSVVLLVFPNSKLLLKHVFAVLLAGYVPALVAPSTPISRLNDIANNFNAKAIIRSKLFENGLDNFDYITQIDKHDVVVLNNSKELLTQPGEVILTTSGTSGFSSGCVFDFAALIKNAEKHAEAINLSKYDTVLVNLPLFYSYAFVAQALASYVMGSRLVISSPPFSCSRFVSDVEKYQVTISSITPLLVKELLTNSVKIPSCLRTMTVGGDALDVTYIESLLTRGFARELYLTYGITEAGPRVATLAAHKEPMRRFSSVGKLLPETYARLDTFAGSDNQGELLIHSNTLAKKRLGNSSKPLFVTIDDRAWLKTGDIFTIDDDGYLYYKNRISDFVVLNGEKVNLAEIKKIAATKFRALSAKVNLIKSSDGLVGYDLDIIVQKDFDKNIEDTKRDIRSGLKIFERPRNIEISTFGEKNVERYK